MTTGFYLDKRGLKNNDFATIKISLCHKGRTLYIPTTIRVAENQWDAAHARVILHPHKAQLNTFLATKKLEVDTILFNLSNKGKLVGLDVCGIKKRIEAELAGSDNEGNFMRVFDTFTADHDNKGTKAIYATTAKVLRDYLGNNADILSFEGITYEWLTKFDRYMEKLGMSLNYRSIHLRNIRAVVNYAITEEYTSQYAFRKFKIRSENGKDRSLSIHTLSRIFSSATTPWQQECVDIFKLMIYFCGINIVDLCKLPKTTERIEYKRTKTGQQCSLAIIPEAQEIIEKYAGKTHLLNIAERYTDYRDYAHRINDGLKSLGLTYHNGLKPAGEPLNASLSTYYSRYTWATIAAELDIPTEVIGAALGHSKGSVTDIYIRANYKKKVDIANRQVIDYILSNINE